MNGGKTACVMLPTYNEVESIPVLIPQILKEARSVPDCRVLILVVDDASPDGTARAVERLSRIHSEVFLLSGERRGIGAAYLRGLTHALKTFDPDLVLQMDADFQHDPALLPSLIRACMEGADIVIASRLVPGGGMPGLSRVRKAMTMVANRALCCLNACGPPRDFTSGYRCIRASLLTDDVLSARLPSGYAFVWVLLLTLLRQGRPSVREIPLRFVPRRWGASKLGLTEGLEFLHELGRALVFRGRRGP